MATIIPSNPANIKSPVSCFIKRCASIPTTATYPISIRYSVLRNGLLSKPVAPMTTQSPDNTPFIKIIQLTPFHY